MKTKIAIASLATAAVSVPLFVQHRSIAALEEKRAAVPPSSAIAADNSDENQLTALWERHLRNRPELERLRAEADSLRKTSNADPAALQRLAAARTKFEAAKAAAKQANDTIEATQIRIRTINAMKHLGLAARIFSTDNQDRFPQTFDQMTNELGEIGLPLETFEFVQHEREISEREPQLILFREKQPRKQPDGKWQRGYTFADGSVQTINQDTPDFSEWESKFIGHKDDAQAQP